MRQHHAEAVRPDDAHARRAATATSSSSSRPRAPISLNPAEMTIAPLTPAAAQSRHDLRDGSSPGSR